MKDHAEIQAMLAALAGGDLAPADQALVEQHLISCSACRHELAQLQAVMQAVRAMPEQEPPPWLVSRIMAQVREEAVPQRSWLARLFLPLQVKLPLEALALVMICVTAWYVLQDVEHAQQRSQTPAPAQLPAAENAKDTAMQASSEPQRQSSPVASGAPAPAPAASVVPKTESRPSVPSDSFERQQTPATPPAFAPPSKMAADRTEQAERSKAASEAVSAAPSVSREQAPGAPAPMMERKLAAKRKAEGSDSRLGAAALQPFRLRLAVDGRTAVAEPLLGIVKQLGGTVRANNPNNILISIQVSRLPELMERVTQLGVITERPIVHRGPDEWLELAIFW